MLLRVNSLIAAQSGADNRFFLVSFGWISQPTFYSATIAVTAFRALGIYPGKIATQRIEPGWVDS